MNKILDKIATQFGYTVIPTELWECMKNELASLMDAIKVYENKNKEKKND